MALVDDKYDDNSKDDDDGDDHDDHDDDNVAHEVAAELKTWFLNQVGLPVAPEDLQEHRGLWGNAQVKENNIVKNENKTTTV